MTWIEAAGHSNWLMRRDGPTQFKKNIKAKAIGFASASTAYPSFVLMSHEEINFIFGFLISSAIFAAVFFVGHFFVRFEFNSDSDVHLIGLMEDKGIKKVEYDQRHYIYEALSRYLIKYEDISNYCFEEIAWEEWRFVNLKITSKKSEIFEIGIPKDFYDKESDKLLSIMKANVVSV
jgi:hypothetical protein